MNPAIRVQISVGPAFHFSAIFEDLGYVNKWVSKQNEKVYENALALNKKSCIWKKKELTKNVWKIYFFGQAGPLLFTYPKGCIVIYLTDYCIFKMYFMLQTTQPQLPLSYIALENINQLWVSQVQTIKFVYLFSCLFTMYYLTLLHKNSLFFKCMNYVKTPRKNNYQHFLHSNFCKMEEVWVLSYNLDFIQLLWVKTKSRVL